MVERPIKKSERQAVTESNDVVKAPETEPITNEGSQEVITQSSPESNESTHVVKEAPKIKPITTASAQDAITQSLAESNEFTHVVKAPETELITNEGAQDAITQPSKERSITKPLLAKDKKQGKGRGEQRKDEQSIKPPANLALMRGPKPTKAKPPVIPKTQEETPDSTTEVDQEET
jgi:hypothetical protein